MKEALGALSVILAAVAYAPYIRDTIKGKTKPHPYSWFIWGLLTLIIFALQYSKGAGPGSWVSFSVGISSIGIFILTLKKNGRRDISKSDTVAFLSALAATLLWLVADQPLASMILLVSIDMIGFIPTIRKSWSKPEEETLITWEITAFRHFLSIFAIRTYNGVTVINPAAWTIANTLFAGLLIYRRKKLSARGSPNSALR